MIRRSGWTSAWHCAAGLVCDSRHPRHTCDYFTLLCPFYRTFVAYIVRLQAIMVVVVSGATGFIGSHLVDLLLERGFTVKCLVRPSSNLRWLADKNVELCECVLSDQERLNEICKGAHYIVHCAGSIAAHSLEEYIRDNKGGTEHMLRAALTTVSTLKRFIHLSSMSVCGPARSEHNPLHSDSECKPITSYGISKLEAEKAIHHAMGRLPITIIRPPAVYGERDEATLSFFAMLPYHIAPLIGFGQKWISIVHVSDLVRGIADAMESEKTKGRTYFLSDSTVYNWDQIASVAANILNVRVLKLHLPHFVVLLVGAVSGALSKLRSKSAVFNYEKAIDFIQPYWICGIDEAKRDFNYEPKISLQAGLQRTLDWYRSQGWL